MKKRKTLKILFWTSLSGIIVAATIILYLFNMPHRNINRAEVDYTLTTGAIVREYLTNKDAANNKYLSENGESKVLKITGLVKSISKDYEGHTVVLLKKPEDKAGVSCTFAGFSNTEEQTLHPGTTITVKGVIRSGASYDEDLGMYENVILEKCNIIK